MAEANNSQLARLIQDLRSGDWKVATQAQQSLARLGEEALPPLGELLNDDLTVAWRAAWVLGRLKNRRAVPLLTCRLLQLYAEVGDWPRLLEGRKTLLLSELVEALGMLGDPAGTAAVCAALSSPNQGVRDHAKRAIARFGRGAVPHLCACLGQLSARDLAVVVPFLGAAEDARVVKPLCELLEHEDELVRLRATEVLGLIAPKFPVLELRTAIPYLERQRRRWAWSTVQIQDASRRTLRCIEKVTGHLQDVPLPSVPPSSDRETLPLPAASAGADAAGLLPAGGSSSPCRSSGWLGWLRNWLRRGER
jgi:HEAT repeat protein